MDTSQKQSIDQNLRKVAETARFSDICQQGFTGKFKDLTDYLYLNGEIIAHKIILHLLFFSFLHFKNELL